MKLCRFRLKPVSPWSDRLRSDTLYGLVCWHVAELEGGQACAELIEAFCANNAPFQLSSAMPAGYLPMPVLPPASRKSFRELVQSRKPDSPKDAASPNSSDSADSQLFSLLQKYKKFRKAAWLDLQTWQKHRQSLSSLGIFLDQEREQAEDKPDTGHKTGIEPHVSIDRSTGGARGGQLFFRRLTYFDPETSFHLYARTDNPQWLLKYLRLIGELGFGKDAGTGHGLFEIDQDVEFRPDSLELPEEEAGGAQLLLSTCSGPKLDNVNGFYRLEVKRGKTGPGQANPFKRPFLFLQEGSLLARAPDGPFVLTGINADDRIVQILQPLTLACKLAQPYGETA